jgi:DNA-binding CsgD family transcriptional regulator
MTHCRRRGVLVSNVLEDLRVASLAPGVVVVSWSKNDAPLTAAESDVLSFVAKGMSNTEIATERGTSVRTVANLLARAYKKLGVGSRTSATATLALHRAR